MIQKQMDKNNRKKKSIPKLDESLKEKDESMADKFFSFFGCGPKSKKPEQNSNMDNFRENRRRNSSDEER